MEPMTLANYRKAIKFSFVTFPTKVLTLRKEEKIRDEHIMQDLTCQPKLSKSGKQFLFSYPQEVFYEVAENKKCFLFLY